MTTAPLIKVARGAWKEFFTWFFMYFKIGGGSLSSSSSCFSVNFFEDSFPLSESCSARSFEESLWVNRPNCEPSRLFSILNDR
jgi:hypothetical protein